ncbi:VCBS domain-containing protein [Bradyrhizobium sp. WSM471]|uniref:VCBS domain-containing protein n=1 Tax=Bradyrhizobium sp. WSM471 TaxID=319017 RepID=UPI00024D2250|nr:MULTISPECIES: VCBS domain-containing protein [Bradyrhizobium]EHR01378.1 VCBS repeat-containing protein [Bradyrhizobium sp. WSM471]UFW43442.1 VCBS domain-containing protein [Bradyrhizobium canariense]
MNYTGDFDAARPAVDGQGSHPLASSHGDSFAVQAHGHAPDGALLVPDPNLLFHGEYKRAGVDLVLSNDGREFVVHDYFKGEKRAALSSPDGAHLSGDLVNALAGHVQYAQAAPSTATSQIIGHVTKLAGNATAIRNGVSIILNNGDDVQKGDVLVTGSDSTLGVTFIDGTVFGLSSNARMVLNEMIYDPNGSNNASLLSLIAGTISFVAGETAKHGDMKIDTPVATMGIRGTAVLTQISFFVPLGGGDPQPHANFQVLVEPDGTTGSYVLFDKITLLPIGTVNQAGQMIQISGGNVSVSNALLSPEVQKLISDVFSLKFSANSDNTRLTTNFTDTVTPDSRGLAMNGAGGLAGIPNFNFTIAPEKTAVFNQTGDLFIPFISIKSVDVISASDKASFTIADQVIITDSNPADVLVPYVPGTATIKSVSGPSTAPPGADLAKLLTLNAATGAISYDPAKFAFLGANQNVVVILEFDSRAGSEIFHKALSLTITGSNDPATILGTATGTVMEDGGLTAHGVLMVHDVDTGQDNFQTAASLAGAYGTFTFDPTTGEWSYTLDNTAAKVRALADGQVVHDTLTVKSADGTASQLIDITITGSNDAAVISGTGIGAVKEDYKLTACGTLTVHDADTGEDHFQTPATLAGAYGTFTFNPATGDWSYTLDNSAAKVQGLAGGQVVHDTLTVKSADGTASQLIDVTITGSNDAAAISGAVTGAVEEDGKLTACGTLTVQDADTGQDYFQTPASLAGTYGAFTFDPATGDWSYSLDNSAAKVQALAGGEIIHQTLTVKSADGTASQLIDVTITGSNDAAAISGAVTGAVKEDGKLTACGTLTVQDADTGQDNFQTPASLAGTYGTFTFDPATGEWSYTLDNSAAKVQALAGGEIVHDTLTVMSADGTASQLIDVTITGSNDAAVISGTATGAVKEDGRLTACGTLKVQDIDTGQDHFQTPASLAAAYGTFTFDPASGEWSYTLDNSAPKVQALAGGQVVHDTLTVKSADGIASQLIDVTIAGSNDAAVISGTAIGTVKEDGKLSACGMLTVQDLDTGQDHFQTPASLAGTYGAFTFDPATGDWSYTLDNSAAKVQALAGGQIVHDTLTVKSADGTASQLIDVTITGSDDAAAISGAAIGAVEEDGKLTACGTLTVQDADTGQDHFQIPGSPAGTYGTFTFDPATGDWGYTLDNSAAKVQGLVGGQVVHDTLTVKSADGTASELIDVTITGKNDAAIISGKLSGNVEIPDDGPGSGKLTDTGKVTDTDIDNNPNTFIPKPAGSATSHGYGTYQLTASGIWTYTLDYSNPTVHRLDEGQHLNDTFTVQTIDGTAKVVTTTISDDDPPHRAPAGVAGSEINLGLADPFLQSGAIVTVTLAGVADDWIVTDEVRSADGTWSVQTADPASLSITTPGTFEGAALLIITEVVTTQDGTSTNHVVADNVEAYAQGRPIFAYAGDDFLTAASGHDLIVFSQPIGHDLLYNFDVRADQIDLIGFSATDFGAVQAHMLDDVSGSAVIALGDEQSITLPGISSSSLTASNFVFDLAPAFSNVGTMSVSDGALLPISGEMNNTGTVLVSAAGDETIVQLIQPGLTLKGGGQFLLSDDNSNIISGTSPNVTLNNENNVISGAGQLGNGQLNFINAGNVNATGNQPLIIDTGSNVIHNAGILEASGPGGLIVVSAVDNSGFLWANTANLTVKGAVSGNGTAIIDGPGLLEFEAASNANVVFGLASGGTLSLGDAFHFNGTISGFNDLDIIELNNFNPDSATISYVQNANTGGTLTIANGAQVAHLTLLGDYTADSFNLVSDLPGHALVTYAHQGIIS